MKLKLTKAGRAVVFVAVAAVICVGGYFGYQHFSGSETGLLDNFGIDSIGNEAGSSASAQKINTDDTTINLSLDEWIGWKPIIDANQGLTTQPGSIFDKLGVNVNINIINDAEASSNALIKGDLNAAGYTINRTAFLSDKFQEAGLDVVMPVLTNYSDGGDGIIALNEFNSIESLVNAKIGVPKFSEAQSLVIWFVNKSDLPDADKQKIIDNLVLMDDAEQTGQAFFAGKLDAAATWEPFLSNAEESTNSHTLFSTASSSKLIVDGILFRNDFVQANPETISAFIDGIFQAEEMYKSDFTYVRAAMPMFADSSDADIAAMCDDAGLMGYAENIKALEDECLTVYTDMCTIWESIGETPDRALGATLFDSSYVKALSDRYSSMTQDKSFEITEEQRASAVDVDTLLAKSATINFMPNTAKFVDNAEADAALKEFVEIAKTLDGAIIQIEGNINYHTNTEGNMKLSEERAKTVKNYFVANGIDPNRIITIGNGNTKMLVAPDSPDADKNRRTDVFFKIIEM